MWCAALKNVMSVFLWRCSATDSIFTDRKYIFFVDQKKKRKKNRHAAEYLKILRAVQNEMKRIFLNSLFGWTRPVSVRARVLTHVGRVNGTWMLTTPENMKLLHAYVHVCIYVYIFTYSNLIHFWIFPHIVFGMLCLRYCFFLSLNVNTDFSCFWLFFLFCVFFLSYFSVYLCFEN